MKNLEKVNNVEELSSHELVQINGGEGGFWGDVGVLIGATAKALYAMSLGAKDYYSLPAHMKK